MDKTYYNSAMTGNSGMLCCLSDKGELVRMYWPYIDYLQRTGSFMAGIFLSGESSGTKWFQSDFGGYRQKYIEDTNIVRTTYSGFGLDIVQTDFVIPDRDVLVRRFDITASGSGKKDMEMLVYSSTADTDSSPHGMLFDFNADALAHYRHNSFIYIGADAKISNFQIGNDALKCAACNNFSGTDDIGMMNDGTFSLSLGNLQPGQKISTTLYICAAETQNKARVLLQKVKSQRWDELFEQTQEYWAKKLSGSNNVSFADDRIQTLYRRTILYFHLMSDKKTGGLLASAEIDEHHTKCGGYGYCWGRDAAFITPALDLCGLTGQSEMFYRWAAKIQDAEGFWHQRYCIDGSLAPSWGLQIDETGSIVWGILQHYRHTKDINFLSDMWKCVEKAVGFLLMFKDEENGLPNPCFDLWEERYGIHAYSAAAVYGGLTAGAEISEILGKSGELTKECREVTEKIRGSLISLMWNEKQKRFLRSVKTKLNPWGPEVSDRKTIIKDKPKGNCCKEVTLEDATIDASLMGISVPFELFAADDEKMRSTVEQIERNLSFEHGGIGRYENDGYIGGNPWIVTTLWAAIYNIEKKDYEKALQYFNWALEKTTETGLLPEQVGKESGKPVWVYGLTWSHSMFILALFKLMEAGLIDYAKKP